MPNLCMSKMRPKGISVKPQGYLTLSCHTTFTEQMIEASVLLFVEAFIHTSSHSMIATDLQACSVKNSPEDVRDFAISNSWEERLIP